MSEFNSCSHRPCNLSLPCAQSGQVGRHRPADAYAPGDEFGRRHGLETPGAAGDSSRWVIIPTPDQVMDTPIMWQGKYSVNKDEYHYTRGGTKWNSPTF